MRLFNILVCIFIIGITNAYAQNVDDKAVLITDAPVEEGFMKPHIFLTGSVYFTKISNTAAESASKVVKVFVKDGDNVKKGQPIAQLDDSFLIYSIKAAEAATKQAQLSIEKTKRDYLRNRTLYEQHSVSQQKYQDSLTDYENAENAYKVASANEAKLKTEKEKMIVKAPFDGIITSTPIEVGEWLSAGATAASVASLTYEARVNIPEKVLDFIQPSNEVTIEAAGQEYVGTVVSINSKGDTATRTFETKITMGEDIKLKEGMQAIVQIPSGQTENALFVPRDAIVDHNMEKGVYKITGDKVQFISVRILGNKKGKTALSSNILKIGDRVAVKGNNRIKNGSIVSVAKKAYN